VLRLPFNLGVGGAMRAGFLHAHRNGFAAVVQLDATASTTRPGPHAAAEPGRAGRGRRGRRRFDGEGTTPPRAPALGDVPAGEGGQPPHGVRLTDVTSGFRVAGPRAVSLFAQRYPADYLGDTVESLLLAHAAGLRLASSRADAIAQRWPAQHPAAALDALPAAGAAGAGRLPRAGRSSGRSVPRS
jgi:hypothetical protein